MRLLSAYPQTGARLETFVRDQLEGLAPEWQLTEGWHPYRFASGELLHPLLGIDAVRGVLRRLAPRAFERWYRGLVTGWLSKHSPDAVLAHYGPMGATLAEACHQAKVPLIVHFYGFDAHHHAVHAEYAETYRSSLFRTATAVIVVSGAMGEELVRLGCPREKIHLIPCGVALSRFAGGNPAQAAPHLVTTMRLVSKKGPLLLVRAFAEVCGAVPEARLTVVGDGPEEPAIRALVAQLELGERVNLAGALAPPELAEVLRTARAYVQPSVPQPNGDTEGTPVALLEASATGLPIVATRVGGIPDAVVNEVTGYLVEPGDWQALVEPLTALLSQPELAAKMGAAARAHVAANYDQRTQIARLRGVIEASVAQHPAKRV